MPIYHSYMQGSPPKRLLKVQLSFILTNEVFDDWLMALEAGPMQSSTFFMVSCIDICFAPKK